jgi:outer membrane protein TolC
LAFAYDYGLQGEDYTVNDDSKFWRASLVASWNLFRGGADKARRQQARVEHEAMLAKKNELELAVRMEVLAAVDALKAARATIVAAENQYDSARKSFEIVSRKFQEGIAPQIEFLDARNTLTNAGVNRIITRYDFYIKAAELERSAALFPIQSYLANRE